MEPLRVALPLGIGDCHWSVQKLRGLSELHGGRPIRAFVNESEHHHSWRYLALVPFIAEAQRSECAPHSIRHELAQGYQDERWATREGSRDWNGFDYVMVANGHLEAGRRIEAFFPDVPTDYTYDLEIPTDVAADAERKIPRRRVLLYPSGCGPNAGFHGNTWTVDHWRQVISLLNDAGHEPVLIGAPTEDDMTYRDQVVWRATGLRFLDRVGSTSHGEVLAAIRDSAAWCGLNSGLGIVAASQYVPTVMLWADNRYRCRGAHTQLHHRMQRSWLCEEQLATYRTVSYGSPEISPAHVVEQILEVARS